MEREPGNQILEVEGLKATDEDGTVLFDNVSFNIEKGEKVVFLSHNPKAMTALFEIINGNREAGVLQSQQLIFRLTTPNSSRVIRTSLTGFHSTDQVMKL